jgi:formate dehydrogenase alpha subunit
VVDRYLREGYTEDLASRYSLAGEGQVARSSRKVGSFTLVVGQTLFHSGKLSTRAKGLLQIQAAGFLGLNPGNAQQIGATEGDRVRISNEQGEMTTTVKLLDRVPDGLALFPEHFAENARRLLRLSTDPQTGVPSYRTTQVKVEKI